MLYCGYIVSHGHEGCVGADGLIHRWEGNLRIVSTIGNSADLIHSYSKSEPFEVKHRPFMWQAGTMH